LALYAVYDECFGAGWQVRLHFRRFSKRSTSLAAAEEAGDEDKVRFLRKRLEALDTKEILLREEKKSMAAQPGGQNCCMNTDCSATNWLAYLPELVCLDSTAC